MIVRQLPGFSLLVAAHLKTDERAPRGSPCKGCYEGCLLQLGLSGMHVGVSWQGVVLKSMLAGVAACLVVVSG